jgi:hypothetical protein
MNWMDELEVEKFKYALRQTFKSMRNEFRKVKIKRIFGWE